METGRGGWRERRAWNGHDHSWKSGVQTHRGPAEELGMTGIPREGTQHPQTLESCLGPGALPSGRHAQLQLSSRVCCAGDTCPDSAPVFCEQGVREGVESRVVPRCTIRADWVAKVTSFLGASLVRPAAPALDAPTEQHWPPSLQLEMVADTWTQESRDRDAELD